MQGHLGQKGPTLGQPCLRHTLRVSRVASRVAYVLLLWDREIVGPIFQVSPFDR